VGSILYGYDLGVIAGVVASPDFKARFDPNEAESGAVVSVFTGGAFFGAMFAGPAGDYFGRRLTILIGSIIFILGGGLQTGAQSLEYLYAGRVIAGIGVGFLVMIIPLYQAEIAHPSIRGSVTALQQFMLGIGALVASWTTFGTNQNFANNDSMQWRLSLGIQVIPAVVLGLLIMFFPESPRYTLPVITRTDRGTLTNKLPDGSSTTASPRKASKRSPNSTLMAMSTILGSELNTTRSATRSSSNTKMPQNPIWSYSPTNHASAVCCWSQLSKQACR
jgi:MFS family permease